MPTALFPLFFFCKKSTEDNTSNRENQPVNNVDSVICGKRIECVHDNAVFENADIKKPSKQPTTMPLMKIAESG